MIPLSVAEAKQIFDLSLSGYASIRASYRRQVYDAVLTYLTGDRMTFRRPMRHAIFFHYRAAAVMGWKDGGGTLPWSDEADAWFRARREEEFAYSRRLYVTLRELRRGDDDYNPKEVARMRARGYAASLDAVYATMKVLAAGNKMLTFGGQDGEESCEDCQYYKGQRHRASWWWKHNAIPPNREFECGGYRCQHILFDDDGKLFTM